MKDKYFTVSVKDLQKQYEEKTAHRLSIYKPLIERCFMYIQSCADKENTMCIYKIPRIKWGLPVYKMDQCIEYITIKLKEKGFKCNQIQRTNAIYISWNVRKPNLKLLEYKANTYEQPIVPHEPKHIDMMPIRKTIQFNTSPPPPKKYPNKSAYKYRPSGRQMY